MSTIKFAKAALETARAQAVYDLERIDAALEALTGMTEPDDHVSTPGRAADDDSRRTPVVECDVEGCDWTGATPQALGHHRRQAHKPEKVWTCNAPGCDFETTSPSALGGHRSVHNSQAITAAAPVQSVRIPNECDECGETFDWPGGLRQHRRDTGHKIAG